MAPAVRRGGRRDGASPEASPLTWETRQKRRDRKEREEWERESLLAYLPTRALKPLPGRNLTFVEAGLAFVVYSAPVKGFVAFLPPFWAGLMVFEKTPMPLTVTRSFFLRSLATDS